MALVLACVAVSATGNQVFSIGALERRIETQLSQQFAGVAVDVEDMRLRVDLGRRHLNVHADSIRLAGQGDAPDTVLSDIGAQFSLPELMHGQVNPRGLTWGGIRLGVVADENGNLVMGLNAASTQNNAQTGQLPAFLGQAYASAPSLGFSNTDGIDPKSTLGPDLFQQYSRQSWVSEFFDAAPTVSTLVLNEAALSYRDLRSGLGIETRKARFSLVRQDDGKVSISLDGQIAVGQILSKAHPRPASDDNWTWQLMPISATASLDDKQRVQSLRVSLPELQPQTMTWLAPDNPFWTSADGTLDVQASVHLDNEGTIERFSGHVDGLLKREFHFSGKPVSENQGWRLDLLASGLTPSQDPYLSQHFDVLAAVGASFSGTTTLFLDPQGTTKIYQISASQDAPGTLNFPTVWAEPQRVRKTDVNLWGDATTWDMTTNGMQVAVGDDWVAIDLIADGQQTVRGAQVRMDIAARSTMSERQIRSLWPDAEGVDDPARDWFDDNLISAVFVDPELSFQMSGQPDGQLETIDSLKLDFDYRDARVQVTPAMGVASIDQGKFSAQDQMVNVIGTQGSLGPLEGANLNMTVDLATPNRGLLSLTVDIEGDVVPSFEWMATADMGLGNIQDQLPLSQMSGRSAGQFNANVPLTDDEAEFERLFEYRYDGQIDNFAVLDLLAGQSVRGTGARIVSENAGTSIVGAVSIGSDEIGHTTTAEIDLKADHERGELSVRGDFQSTVQSLVPFISNLAEFGRGGVQGQFQYNAIEQQDHAALEVAADLQSVEIDLPFVFYRKPAGMPATTAVSVALKDNEPVGINRFRVVANDAQTSGRVEFSQTSGGPIKIWMNDVALQGSAIRDMNLVVADKQIDVQLRGGVINAIPAVDNLFGGNVDPRQVDPGRREKGFGLEADAVILVRAQDIDRIFLPKDKIMRNVSASLLLQNNGVEHMRFRGQPPAIHPNRAPDAGYLTASIEPVTGGYTFTLTTDDAGAAMHATNINENVRLGSLQIQAYSPLAFPHGAWRGSLNGENIFLYNAPIFGRLFQVASLTGIGEVLSGTGLGFSKVNADFNYAPGNIHIDNWQMLGPSIGMTGQGGIYFDAQQVNLRGTVTPLGVLNEITQQLPLFGTLLNGLDGGGLFSATYAIQGPFDDPNMYVNPWTSLTPGAFRDLYKALTGSF